MFLILYKVYSLCAYALPDFFGRKALQIYDNRQYQTRISNKNFPVLANFSSTQNKKVFRLFFLFYWYSAVFFLTLKKKFSKSIFLRLFISQHREIRMSLRPDTCQQACHWRADGRMSYYTFRQAQEPRHPHIPNPGSHKEGTGSNRSRPADPCHWWQCLQCHRHCTDCYLFC